MSDLFHEEMPDSYIRQVFDVIRRAPQHKLQVLTKRAARLATSGAGTHPLRLSGAAA